jgi:sRNA-binding carbon storage regulator CsrA
MLCLHRKPEEAVIIRNERTKEELKVLVTGVKGHSVYLGLEGPDHYNFIRDELLTGVAMSRKQISETLRPYIINDPHQGAYLHDRDAASLLPPELVKTMIRSGMWKGPKPHTVHVRRLVQAMSRYTAPTPA